MLSAQWSSLGNTVDKAGTEARTICFPQDDSLAQFFLFLSLLRPNWVQPDLTETVQCCVWCWQNFNQIWGNVDIWLLLQLVPLTPLVGHTVVSLVLIRNIFLSSDNYTELVVQNTKEKNIYLTSGVQSTLYVKILKLKEEGLCNVHSSVIYWDSQMWRQQRLDDGDLQHKLVFSNHSVL